MGKVYLCQDVPSLDFTKALKYGTPISAVFPPGQVSASPQVALGQARKVLREITADDWLVLVGDPVMIGICWTVVSEYLGKVRALRWDRFAFDYFPIEVNMVERIST